MSKDRISDDDIVTFALDAVELDDVVLDHGIILVAYIDPETGRREHGWRLVGEPSIDQTIGLMAIAQHRIDHHTTDEDDDDGS